MKKLKTLRIESIKFMTKAIVDEDFRCGTIKITFYMYAIPDYWFRKANKFYHHKIKHNENRYLIKDMEMQYIEKTMIYQFTITGVKQ